jgi:hypothetical protein
VNEAKRKLGMILLQLQQLGMISPLVLPPLVLNEKSVVTPLSKQSDKELKQQQQKKQTSITWTPSSDQSYAPFDNEMEHDTYNNSNYHTQQDNNKSIELTKRNLQPEQQKQVAPDEWKSSLTKYLDENTKDIGKIQVRKAILELYRFLELLKSYKDLNINAYKKIVKKYEKLTNHGFHDTLLNELYISSFYIESDLIDLMNETEDLFRIHFANGNRANAMKSLRTINTKDSSSHSALYYMFASGIFLGLILMLIIIIGIYFVH